MTAEILFEQQFADVGRTRAALQRCEKQLVQIPKVLNELCGLLKGCAMSLDQIVNTPAVDPDVVAGWNNAKARFLVFADGKDVSTFAAYCQREVTSRLDTLAERTESVYTAGKERRDAREKFLKSAGKKADTGKSQRMKDAFSVADQEFGALYTQLNASRAKAARPVAHNFFLGHSSMLFAAANALCVDDNVLTAEEVTEASHVVPAVTAVEERDYRPPERIATPIKGGTGGSPQRRLSAVAQTSASSAGLAASHTRAQPTPISPCAPGIPIYYGDARTEELARVQEALPGNEDGAALVQSPPANSGRSPPVQRARRSTAPTAAHFSGVRDGGPPAATLSRQTSLRADQSAADTQYHAFFEQFLADT